MVISLAMIIPSEHEYNHLNTILVGSMAQLQINNHKLMPLVTKRKELGYNIFYLKSIK